jgi:hypothetical protein
MEKVKAIFMLEILGKPAEYIKEQLEEIVGKLEKEDKVEVKEKKIAEAKKIKDKELFTSFAEVELETSLDKLMLLIFSYMPSNVDIITPEKLEIKNNDLNTFLNELIRKLHQYDELARTMMLERQKLVKQIKEGKVEVRDERKKKD